MLLCRYIVGNLFQNETEKVGPYLHIGSPMRQSKHSETPKDLFAKLLALTSNKPDGDNEKN